MQLRLGLQSPFGEAVMRLLSPPSRQRTVTRDAKILLQHSAHSPPPFAAILVIARRCAVQPRLTDRSADDCRGTRNFLVKPKRLLLQTALFALPSQKDGRYTIAILAQALRLDVSSHPRQRPGSHLSVLDLVLDVSLELGSWCLVAFH